MEQAKSMGYLGWVLKQGAGTILLLNKGGRYFFWLLKKGESTFLLFKKGGKVFFKFSRGRHPKTQIHHEF